MSLNHGGRRPSSGNMNASATSASSYASTHDRPRRRSRARGEVERAVTPEQIEMDVDSVSPSSLSSISSSSHSMATSSAAAAEDSLVLGRAKRTALKSRKALEAEETGQSRALVKLRRKSRERSSEDPIVVPVVAASPPRGVQRSRRLASGGVPRRIRSARHTDPDESIDADTSTEVVAVPLSSALSPPNVPDTATAIAKAEEAETELALTEDHQASSSAAATSVPDVSVPSRPRRSTTRLSQVTTAAMLAASPAEDSSADEEEAEAASQSIQPDSRPLRRARASREPIPRRSLPPRRASRGKSFEPRHQAEDVFEQEQSNEVAEGASPSNQLPTQSETLPFRWRSAMKAAESSVAATRPRRSTGAGGISLVDKSSDEEDEDQDSVRDTPDLIEQQDGSSRAAFARSISPNDSTLSSICMSEDEDDDVEEGTPVSTDVEPTRVKKPRKPSRATAQKKVSAPLFTAWGPIY